MHGVRGDAPYPEDEWKDALRAGRYRVEYHIMREMGWAWRDLMDAPFDLVQELIVRIGAERHWQEEKRKHPIGKKP
ncbi:MAG: hypothetical protein ACOYD4_06875 [Solirubrobacterales bacterium]